MSTVVTCPMHTTDRYVLALAMLDGDRGARQVLADMLEEQGERGLAQWARQGRHDKRRTLEFGVMLLSCRPAIGMAAEFVGKTSDPRNGPVGDRMVVAAQAWASQRMEAREALETCRLGVAEWLHHHRYSHEFRYGYMPDNRWHLLIGAMQLAIDAEKLAANGDPARAAAREVESRQLVRQIVRQMSSMESQLATDDAIRYLSYVGWQTEQLQQLLKALIASEEDLWPR